MGTPDFETIVSIIRNREAANSPLLRAMIEVQQRYNGEYVIPWLTEEDAPELPPLTPAIITNSIDNYGMRAGSLLPDIDSPALNAAKETGVRSREYARIRRKILEATWYRNGMKLHLRRAYRHLGGYATTTMGVIPDHNKGLPKVLVRNPLQSYPEPRAAEDLDPPTNIAFVYMKSADWLRANYPQSRQENGGPIPAHNTYAGSELWDCCEWIDEYSCVLGILGPHETTSLTHNSGGFLELKRYPNHMGVCGFVTPARVTLDKIVSAVANITGIVDLQARLQALDILATEKAIFPDRYIIGNGNTTPTLVGGRWQDGREGGVNIILDATGVGVLNGTPDPANKQSIDRLERNANISAGNVPGFQGETYGALRTGRGIDAMAAMAVDPRIQEMQEVMETQLPYLNEAILRCYKGYWPSRQITLFTGSVNDGAQFEFVPAQHIETTENVVNYALPGSDIQGATITIGQLVGMGLLSRASGRRKHPSILDADSEQNRIDEEKMEDLAMNSLMQQALGGQIPLTYVAAIEKHRKTSTDIFEAIRKADEQIRKEQASIPAPAPDGMVASPDAMPGLAGGPGAVGSPGSFEEYMASQPPAGIVAPTENSSGLKRLMAAVSATPNE